nr:reverse transcriptase domain-containing protein [Tanacetum cinerariifolium]
MPKFASTIKSLLTNKDKLFELAKIPLNENCSEMLIKKLPKKLGDPVKFLIPCDFSGIDVCHALADLGASINLMPLSIWKKISLPELTPTQMTLELADRSITRPKRVAEDVFIKVEKFHFLTDFIVVDFEGNPRVPLILRRSFLRIDRALIDVYGEEITLLVNDEAITFNLNQTTRYSSTYDYSKENYLETFTPQKQLTPEQIFWSDDLLKMKAKALKEKAKSAKPIATMTVYPPTTPPKLVLKVLPTKSQGIQKALIYEIKEMKEVFDQIEVEVDQNAVDKKCDEIERNNLLIENENLIAKCLSKDVFYTATDSMLTVSRFSDMHDAYTVAQKRIVKLEAENSNLTQKIQKDDHDLNAKVNAVQDLNECFRAENKKVKQHYKESYDSIKLMHAKTIEKTTSLSTKFETLKAQIKGKMKCITMPDPVKPKVLAPGMYAIDVEPIPPRNRNNREVHLEYLIKILRKV